MKTAALLSEIPPDMNAAPAADFAVAPLICALDERWIPQMLALQNDHGDGQVVQRTAAQLEAHFAAGHKAIGAVVGDRLVGQALVTNRTMPPQTLSRTFGDAAAGRDFLCSTVGGVLVAADMRGKNLMDRLIERWAGDAVAQGCDLLHARVRVGNVRSWKNFLHQGLHITDVGPSPDEAQYSVYSMYRPLKAVFSTSALDTKSIGADAVDAIERSLAEGYIGTGWDAGCAGLKMAAFHGLQP